VSIRSPSPSSVARSQEGRLVLFGLRSTERKIRALPAVAETVRHGSRGR
jgi:hypothetical protein